MDQNVIYEVLRGQRDAAPAAVAVFDETRCLTRAALDRLIDTIAVRLPPAAKRVGIVMEHTVEMIAAIFAVLKTGKTYIPVEPSFPRERMAFMMRDAAADLILTNSIHREKTAGFPQIFLDPGLPAEDACAAASARPENLAYILYTSGSTGVPKGVAVRNRNVCHYVRAFQNEFHPEGTDVMLQYSVCSFDIFVEEVFTTLLSGAALAIPSAETKKDIRSLMAFVEKHHVTEISGFPYLLLEMNRLPQIPKSLRLLISGGDVLRAGYVSNLIGQTEVYNTYGPSETTVCASYFRCNGTAPLPDGTYPIGKAVPGVQIDILDEDLLPVAPGKAGELCISGDGVSAGYTGSRQKENGAFLHRPDGSVLYRSGDLGYALPDRNIAFLHRKDTQVMIRGKRVEPAEVESVLCRCAAVEQAAVKPFPDAQDLPCLAAYVVLNQTGTGLPALQKELEKFLPDYMIPACFVPMADLPRTANGKVDYGKLPAIQKEGASEWRL